MNIMKKIQAYAFALGIGVLTGCASTKYPTMDKAMDVLEVREPLLIMSLPEGYKMHIGDYGLLMSIAGKYAGTFNVNKIEGENTTDYIMKGSFSKSEHTNELLRTLKEADVNDDKIVTRQETLDLLDRVLENTDN